MSSISTGRHWARSLAAFLIIASIGLIADPASLAAAQQPDKLDAAETRVKDLAKAGKLDAALALSRRLVQAARRELKKDPKLAVFLSELSSLEAASGHLPEAEAAAREALAINSAVSEPDSPVVLRNLAALAEILAKGTPEKLAEAETILSRAIAALEDSRGPGSPEAAPLQRRLADVQERQGRKSEADKLRASNELAAPEPEITAKEASRAETPEPPGASSDGTRALSPASPAPNGEGETAAQPKMPDVKHKFRKESASPPKAGSSTPPPPSSPPPSSASGGAAPVTAAPAAVQDYHVVKVFFGTNRVAADGGPRLTFSDNAAESLTLGEARITVPANHVVPNVERPWTLNVPFTQIVFTADSDDPKRYFTVQSIGRLTQDEFLAHAREQLASSQTFKGQALVFVHGYYNKFDDALYRTAQIAYDMQFDGAAFMFSWPSAGTIDGYGADRVKAANSGGQLRAFLDLVARKTGATRITVIAHSMGNLPLLEALDESLPGPVPSPDDAIDDIVLAAPDVGRAEFATMTGHIKRLRGGVTLYAASNDLALAASRTINGENRAGDTWPGGPLVLPHVDTIDATSTSLQMFRLNHFYVAQSTEVLCDLERLMRTGFHPPSARSPLITSISAATGALYYAFRP